MDGLLPGLRGQRAPDLPAFRHQRADFLPLAGSLQSARLEHAGEPFAAAARPYAIGQPRDYVPQVPGDLVEVDTLDVRPLPGMVFKHFTARDVISRWDVIEVRSRATAAAFLDTVAARMPFALRALQVDGGAEFHAVFEAECARRGPRLLVLPPRSSKLNGAVERAPRRHKCANPKCVAQVLNEYRGWQSQRGFATIRGASRWLAVMRRAASHWRSIAFVEETP